MIDGLKLQCPISDFPAWKRAANIKLSVPVDSDTGEIIERVKCFEGGYTRRTLTHSGNLETYRVRVKQVGKVSQSGEVTTNCYLTLDGSLHKNNFNGENYSPFGWDDLQAQISHVENSLCVSPEDVEILNLEFGVNVQLPFPVFEYLQQNLISYKGKQFNAYDPDRKGVCLGYHCELSQYSVKVYDKAKQFNLPENVMRFELRFRKMHKLNRLGIKILSDLKDRVKVNGLQAMLLDAWDDVLLYDDSINITSSVFRSKERELLRNGQNPKYWEQEKKRLSNAGFYKTRNQFEALIKMHGMNWHEKIKGLIKTEWDTLSQSGSLFNAVKNKKVDNLTIKIKSNSVYSTVWGSGQRLSVLSFGFGYIQQRLVA